MMGNITERDKKLLLFLGCFVFVVGFGLGIIRPLLNANADMDAEIILKEQDRAEMEDKIIRYSQASGLAEESVIEAKGVSQKYFPIMKSQDIDREITETVLSQGLKVEELNIEMPQGLLWIVPYKYADFKAEAVDADAEPKEEEADESETDQLEEETESADSDKPEGAIGRAKSIYAAKVTVQISGDEKKFWKVLDQFNEHPNALRVSKLGVRKLSSGQVVQNILTVELDVYMCDKQTIEE